MRIIKHWKKFAEGCGGFPVTPLGSCGSCATAAACAQSVPQVCWCVQSLWENFSREFSPTDALGAPNGAALRVIFPGNVEWAQPNS